MTAPSLADLHVAAKDAIEELGLDLKQIHGFLPHATLNYLPKGTRIENLPVLNEKFSIDRIEFVHSDVSEISLVKKQIALKPDSSVEEFTTDDLRRAHWKLHLMYRDEAAGKDVKDWSVEDIVNLHARVVDQLFERDVKHPAPPDDGMDDSSEDFERHEASQPNWTKPIQKRFQRIQHSGVKRGEKILIEDVLKHFQTFKLRKPYIYLVGGLANHGETEGDIDILVRDTEDLPEDFKHILHFRLGRALPPEMAERLEIHYDNFHGPFTNFVELFDLTFERVNPKNEVKEMRDLPSGILSESDKYGLLSEREKAYVDVTEKQWEDDDVHSD